MVTLRPARPDEAGALSALARRSKAHWGYSEAFLAACADELTLTAEQCTPGAGRVSVTVAERGTDAAEVTAGSGGAAGGRPVGFVALEVTPPEGELLHLFVDPSAIGTGVGHLLLAAATGEARAAGLVALTIDADPHAERFYTGLGAVRTGTVPSGSIPGRVLPRLRLAVG